MTGLRAGAETAVGEDAGAQAEPGRDPVHPRLARGEQEPEGRDGQAEVARVVQGRRRGEAGNGRGARVYYCIVGVGGGG